MSRVALTMRQLEVLAAVKAGGSLADIAERLGVTRTGIYQTVCRLAAGGYIKLDGREMTPKGERALSNAVEAFRSSLARAGEAA